MGTMKSMLMFFVVTVNLLGINKVNTDTHLFNMFYGTNYRYYNTLREKLKVDFSQYRT